MKKFEVIKWKYKEFWDNGVIVCSVCDKKYFRREGYWIVDSCVDLISKPFPICSNDCANMYILQNL